MSNYIRDQASTVSVRLDRQAQARLFRALQALSVKQGRQVDRGEFLRQAISAAVDKIENDINVVL